MIRVITLLLACLILNGCTAAALWASKEKTPVTVTEKRPVYCGGEPSIGKLNLKKPIPYVILDKAENTWVGIKPADYEDLSFNFQAMLAYIRQLKSVVMFYADCIQAHNQGADTE